MARNVEIKLPVGDFAALRARLEALGARREGTLRQLDRYYALDGRRRAKLRSFGDGRAEWIRYHRPEAEGVRVSDYEVTPARDPDDVPAEEPRVIVRKERELWLLDNVRVHLDRVDGLGTFLELEAVVDAAHDERRCREQVDAIVRGLGLAAAWPIRASYADLVSTARGERTGAS